MAVEINGFVPYGIQNEQSDIRAHVGVLAGCVYVYRTADGIQAISGHNGKPKQAFQPGVDYATALGYPIPWKNIPRILAIPCRKLIEHYNILPTDTTSEKGVKASRVVESLIRSGYFPLPVKPEEVKSAVIQRQGIDLIVQGQWRIQVKCDYRAGEGHRECTGNLYLQIAELNPLKAT